MLSKLRDERGLPPRITVDNGMEFTSRALDHRAYWNKVELDFTRPGNPMHPVMTERLDSMLAGRESFTWDDGVPLHFAGQGQWPKYDKILDLWRTRSVAAPQAENNGRVRWSGYFVTVTEADGEWKRGNPERAVTLLESLPPEARVWHAFRWWLGTL